MKNSTYKQFLTIRSTTTEDFNEKLNNVMKELMYKSPEVTFTERDDYLIAHIAYTEKINIPETIGDQYELQDIRFTCDQCPAFKPIRNKDGSINKSCKYGDCQHAEFGRTNKNSTACEWLYQMLYSGYIGLTMKGE